MFVTEETDAATADSDSVNVSQLSDSEQDQGTSPPQMERQLSDVSASSVGPSCGDTRCSGRGSCVLPADGGDGLRCDCKLGYHGSSCEQTINGSLSLTLTLSILGIILFLLILAFVLAKLRRRKKKENWKNEKSQSNEMQLKSYI